MHSLTIKQPARITESQAMQCAFDAFKHVMQSEGAKGRMKRGESAYVSLKGFDAYVSESKQGEWRVNVFYPLAHNPCAVAFCDAYDI